MAVEDRGDVGLWRVAASDGAPPTRVVGGERAPEQEPPVFTKELAGAGRVEGLRAALWQPLGFGQTREVTADLL